MRDKFLQNDTQAFSKPELAIRCQQSKLDMIK